MVTVQKPPPPIKRRIEPWTPTEAFDQFETLKKYAAVARKRGPTTQGANTAASGLYNAMIKPLVPFGVRGALWYQGEHNATIRDRAIWHDLSR